MGHNEANKSRTLKGFNKNWHPDIPSIRFTVTKDIKIRRENEYIYTTVISNRIFNPKKKTQPV
jgi:hypothetical protein